MTLWYVTNDLISVEILLTLFLVVIGASVLTFPRIDACVCVGEY